MPKSKPQRPLPRPAPLLPPAPVLGSGRGITALPNTLHTLWPVPKRPDDTPKR